MSGADAKKALMALLGEHQFQLEELLEILITKGVLTDAEWEAAMRRRDERGIPPEEWASRCMNPEDNDALDDFFG